MGISILFLFSGLSILIVLSIPILGILLILGLFLYIVGSFECYENEDLQETGMWLMKLPIGVCVFVFFAWVYSLIHNEFAVRPTKEDILGTYQMVEANYLNISEESYVLYSLILKSDNTYRMSKIPVSGLENCPEGNYYYNPDYSSFNFEMCSSLDGMFKIERGFRSFQIKYICGDPDAGEYIYFEKILE